MEADQPNEPIRMETAVDEKGIEEGEMGIQGYDEHEVFIIGEVAEGLLIHFYIQEPRKHGGIDLIYSTLHPVKELLSKAYAQTRPVKVWVGRKWYKNTVGGNVARVFKAQLMFGGPGG